MTEEGRTYYFTTANDSLPAGTVIQQEGNNLMEGVWMDKYQALGCRRAYNEELVYMWEVRRVEVYMAKVGFVRQEGA